MQRFPLVFLLSVVFACGNKAEPIVASSPAPQPVYSFYPKANVYYDTVNKSYLFLGSDGRTWTAGPEIPAAMKAMMDKSVILDSVSQPVWKDNANHRLIYAAALYATATDTVERKAAPPPVAKPNTTEVEPKKQRKGIRKFFDKIFKRKNKEE